MERTILIVEDNPISRKVLRLTLQAEGYRVLEAGDGNTALELIASHRPDLILQDILLPDMHGLELLRQFRAMAGGVEIPIVALSGFMSHQEYGDVVAAEFDELLIKPLEPGAVLQVVQAQLPCMRSPVVQGRGRRILLVDDDPIQLKVARLCLQHLGFEVTTARDGVEALEVARQAPPDAIMSDALMPHMDGFQLCLELRRNPALAHVPMVLLSSNYVEKADESLALRVGANALVPRTPELETAILALANALISGAPNLDALDLAAHDSYTRRVVSQLDRQAGMNARLAQRCALQGMIISVTATLSDALGRRGDLKAALAEGLYSVLDISGVSRGAIFLHKAPDRFTLSASCGFLPAETERLEVLYDHTSLLTEILESGRSISLPSSELHAQAGHEILKNSSVESGILVPLICHPEGCLGVLFLGSTSRILDDTEWIAFARTIGLQMGQAIGLSRALSRVVESEHRNRALLEQANDGIYIMGLDGTILEVNRRAEELHGLPREELVGLKYSDLLDANQSDTRFSASQRVPAGEGMHVTNVVLRGANNRPVWVDFSARQVDLGGERLLFVIVHDVSERMEAERVRMERSRLVALISDVNLAIATQGTLQAMLGRCVETLVQHLDVAFARVWMLSSDERTLELQASAGIYTRLDGSHSRVPVGSTKIGIIAQERVPHLTNDVCNDPHLADPAWAEREKLVAFCGHPLLVDDQLVGVVAAFSRNVLSDMALNALSAVADAIAVGICRKRSEALQAALEKQLLLSQRLEALGQLTGGIAHDFNNLLAVILVNTNFILEDLDPADPRRADAEEIRLAAERAATLTRQFLAFGRRQVLEPRVLELNAVIEGVKKMLRRLIPEDIQLTTRLAPLLSPILADAGQLEQVLVNLAVNARDAMPYGGSLIIETCEVELDESYTFTHEPVKPGSYVMFSVTDTGHGMNQETLRRVFEPFFTTKEVGKGTGMGLATCYGIVKQSGGYIWAYSEPGQGTVFKVYLPRANAEVFALPVKESRKDLHGWETILLVEDDSQVRCAAQRILQAQGYRVLVACNGNEALALGTTRSAAIHLVLTDVVMPGVDGITLSRALLELTPELRVVFMSGYTDNILMRNGLPEGTHLVQKPFTAETLALKIREVLDA